MRLVLKSFPKSDLGTIGTISVAIILVPTLRVGMHTETLQRLLQYGAERRGFNYELEITNYLVPTLRVGTLFSHSYLNISLLPFNAERFIMYSNAERWN